MEETSVGEVPDLLIPPVEVNLFVDEEAVVFQKDDREEMFNNYKKEMLESGLKSSDLEYLEIAYKNLDDVKFIRIHCTSCDRHIGSAPSDRPNRFEHPLLKVLVCLYCYDFYKSGDFEKDEDGSELYCRWCGEGGQVFCCIKCPFVFCKNCINRNLGRGITKIIQSTDWLCFACDTSQISKHRATFWAIQKYSEEMIRKAELTGVTDMLSVDENICCSGTCKKRVDVYSKLMQPPIKKRKLTVTPSQTKDMNTPKKASTSTKHEDWQPSCISQQPEDEVICTPDIIPLVDSRSNSPDHEEPPPPPMVPIVHNFPAGQQVVTPLIICAPGKSSVNVSQFQKTVQTALQNRLLYGSRMQAPNQVQRNHSVVIRKQKVILPKAKSQRDQNVRYFLNSNSVVSSQNHSVNIPQKQLEASSSAQTQHTKDWFDQAVEDYAELSSFVTTKISSLSELHRIAFSSEKLMTDLHRKLQTYLYTAIEKLRTFRRVVQNNFEKDVDQKFKKKMKNPFANKRSTPVTSDENSNDSSSRESFKRVRTKFVLAEYAKPEDVSLNMDVTNASDEETDESDTNQTSLQSKSNDFDDDDDDDDDDVIEIDSKQEVINISDSEDEVENNNSNQPNFLPETLLEKIRDKYHLNLSLSELSKCLSAITCINSQETENLNEKVTFNKDLGPCIKSDLLGVIKELLELPSTEHNSDENSVEFISNDEISAEEHENRNEEQNSEIKLDKDKNTQGLKQNVTEQSTNKESDDNKGNFEQHNGVEKIEKKENDEKQKQEQDAPENEKYIGDIEDILSSNVVIRTKRETKKFEDEFSKFVSDKTQKIKDAESKETEECKEDEESKETEKCKEDEVSKETEECKEDEVSKETEECKGDEVSKETGECKENEKSKQVEESKEIKECKEETPGTWKSKKSLKGYDIAMDIARGLNIIGDKYGDDDYIDNRSLSVPPIPDIFKKVDDKCDEETCVSEKKTTDILLNSGVLALKQIAENCVTPVDIPKSSTECKV